MKKRILTLVAILLASVAAAQNTTAYFMEGTTFRSQLNPAFAPLQGYVNIPVLGGVSVNMNGNLSLDRILYPVNGSLVTLLDGAVPAETALDGLHSRNLLGLDTRVNLIGFGSFTRNHRDFWSFDLNLRVMTETHLPYELFDFLKRGQSTTIRDIGVYAESFIEAGFNYSMPITDKLYVGARAKFLVGAGRAHLNIDRFDVSLNEDSWRADASGRIDVTAAGLDFETTPTPDGRETFQLDDADYSFKGPAGYGFALDLGAIYQVLPDLQVSLAVNDLGFICWSKSDTRTGVMNKDLNFEGVVIGGPDAPKAEFDLGEFEFETAAAPATTKMLRATINAGVEYDLLRHKLGLGLLYNVRLWKYKALHNLMASVNYRPIRWFTLTGSYSFVENRAHAVGFALNCCPSWINFYLATDILVGKHTPQFLPVKQNSINLTLGLGIPIGPRSKRVAAYTPGCNVNYR